jgi:hypothetical protein
MRKLTIAAAVAVLLLNATDGFAQHSKREAFHSGFKLKGAHVYNRSAVDLDEPEIEPKSGWGAGFEFVGDNWGIGLSGFTPGRVSSFDSDSTTFVAIAELNYYAPIRSLRLAPYAGLHSGIGTFSSDYFDDPFLPGLHDLSIHEIGYQFGLRFNPVPIAAIDLQWRQLADSAVDAQDARFEKSQVLLGITLF